MSFSKHRKSEFIILSIGVSLNLFLLGYYKYSGFFVENLNILLGEGKINFESPILPIGISFMTFHSISYLVDHAINIPHHFITSLPGELAIFCVSGKTVAKVSLNPALLTNVGISSN